MEFSYANAGSALKLNCNIGCSLGLYRGLPSDLHTGRIPEITCIDYNIILIRPILVFLFLHNHPVALRKQHDYCVPQYYCVPELTVSSQCDFAIAGLIYRSYCPRCLFICTIFPSPAYTNKNDYCPRKQSDAFPLLSHVSRGRAPQSCLQTYFPELECPPTPRIACRSVAPSYHSHPRYRTAQHQHQHHLAYLHHPYPNPVSPPPSDSPSGNSQRPHKDGECGKFATFAGIGNFPGRWRGLCCACCNFPPQGPDDTPGARTFRVA